MTTHIAQLNIGRFRSEGFVWRLKDESNARLDGATIDGIAVTDLLTYWRAGHGAKSA
jgi:hypothetical protein